MRLVAIVACAGCSYAPTAVTPGSADAPADTTVTPDMPGDAAPDVILPAQPCETPSPTGLLLCYQFDGDLTQLDDSSPNNFDDPTVTGMSPITRTVNGVSSQAAMIDTATVAAHIPQSDALELTGDYTIVAWLLPINSSTGNDGIVDHNGQWAFSIENRLISCWWSRTGLLKSTIASVADKWQLAACVVSGTTGCVYRIDDTGAPALQCRNDLTGPAPQGADGLSIGSFEGAGGTIVNRFRGAIDDVRVYTRALGVEELCVIAGRADCQ